MDVHADNGRIVRAGIAVGLRALLLAGIALAGCASSGAAAPSSDATRRLVISAWTGYAHGDPRPAQAALPALRGNALEPWVAYWALRPTLPSMTESAYENFEAAYAGSEVADRLRGEWLRELGRRRDWDDFARVEVGYDFSRDPQARCYDLQRSWEVNGVDTSTELLALWTAQRTGGAGCAAAAQSLLAAGRISPDQLWARLREFFDQGQYKAALAFVPSLPVGAWRAIDMAAQQPLQVLAAGPGSDPMQQQVAVLALLREAHDDPDQAMRLIDGPWAALPAGTRSRIAYVAARSAAIDLDADAASLYARAAAIAPDRRPDSVTTQWQIRAALRAGDWSTVRQATRGLDAPEWAFWHAVAQRQLGDDAAARAGFAALASPWSFYGQLATEALGQRVALPDAPVAPPTAEQMAAVAADPRLQRALDLYALSPDAPGIWGEAQREWTHALIGADDATVHAAAQLACGRRVWLLCINTSDRIKGQVDVAQRYVMPYRDDLDAAAQRSGVSEAFLYGLIRQESRFAADIRSWAGADGLMQLMPATAKWVAHKTGMGDFQPARITEADTNVTLGSAFVGMLLDRFNGSEAMAAAGYNAGPTRPARWRSMTLPPGDALDGAIFTENIPIAETRDYVKQVLANATVYAAMLSGQPQSLLARLGDPRAVPAAAVGDLP